MEDADPQSFSCFLLALIKPLQAGLVGLSFIHFARWVVIKDRAFPRLASRLCGDLGGDYFFIPSLTALRLIAPNSVGLR